MGTIARTPIDVMLGEMAYDVSDATRYADLQAIASVISNRATALGVTTEQVVANQNQFNAYGKSLPPGAAAYRDLAQAAWDDVSQNGPTHSGLFYATPAAAKNLPSGLNEVAEVTGGHRYFEDPYGRAINTSVGYRAPVDIAAARAAAAQRLAFEVATVNEEGMPTPQARPDILNITQNPALLAGIPLSQIDPAILDALPGATGLTATPELTLAQQLQPSVPAMDPQALASAASRFGEEPAAEISSPADLAAAMSRMNTPATNTFDITQAMNDAIAQSVAASAASKTSRVGANVDPARMADNAPLSNADRALQDMMEASAADVMSDRFGAPAGPVTRSVQTTAIPGQVPSGSYLPGSMPVMDVSGVPANRVQSVAVGPGGMINSPEALAAALGSFPSAMAAQREVAAPSMAEAEAVKGDRIGGIDTTGMDQGRFSPSAIETADAAMKSAIERETGPSNQPADIQGFADAMAAQRGPTSGIYSVEHQMVERMADKALEQAIADQEAKTAAQASSMASNSNLAEGLQAQREVVTPTVTDQMPGSAVAAKTSRLPATEEALSSALASDVAAAAPVARDEFDKLRAAAAKNPANYAEVNPEVMQDAMIEAGHAIPAPVANPLTAQPVAPAVTPALPALETVEVAPQPTVAAPVEEPATVTAPVTKSVPSVTSSMPAVQQRQSTAMSVWNGTAQTGTATDGSTVSRMDDGRIGRYDPKHNLTMFSQDDGSTWSSPIKGNQLAPTSSPVASIQPSLPSRSLISRLASVLSGLSSPTGVATAGTNGGMSVARDGPAGAPGGSGPGGAVGDGSAGGYGSTNGVDPEGTH